MRITDIRTYAVDHARGRWRFVQVDVDSGLTGYGEASAGRGILDALLATQIFGIRDRLVGREVSNIADLVGGTQVNVWPDGSAYAAAVSGVEQALWDIRGKQLGAPVATLFGGARGNAMRAYVNINHGMDQGARSPAAFANRAVQIVSLGFNAIKCAPFEDVQPGPWEDRATRASIELGLDRVAAIRELVGEDVDVMVDCHWHFDSRTARHAVRALEKMGLAWIEGAVDEQDLDGWRRLRDSTDARLAAGETLSTIAEFHRFALASRVEVLQSDVKYVGGLSAMHRVALLADALGMEFAPHNQAGPVQTLAGLQVLVALPNARITELSLAAPELRAALVGGAEQVQDGQVVLPAAPGLGFAFNHAAIEALRNET
jgi:galactonate dehydratase